MSKNVLNIETIVLDFDGVLTDNSVYVSEKGEELVKCNRSDGLYLNLLKKLEIKVFILSTEENKVVSQRARKLKIITYQGIENKEMALEQLSKKFNFSLSNTLYVGNDLNDYLAMKKCGFTACPADSDGKIKRISKYCLKTKGGQGIVKEILQEILKVDTISTMYGNSI